jgi:hypothetical protein
VNDRSQCFSVTPDGLNVPPKEPDKTALSRKELEIVERIATRDGISVDEAATNLGKAALARRVKKRTGKAPARVYDMRRK